VKVLRGKWETTVYPFQSVFCDVVPFWLEALRFPLMSLMSVSRFPPIFGSRAFLGFYGLKESTSASEMRFPFGIHDYSFSYMSVDFFFF